MAASITPQCVEAARILQSPTMARMAPLPGNLGSSQDCFLVSHSELLSPLTEDGLQSMGLNLGFSTQQL